MGGQKFPELLAPKSTVFADGSVDAIWKGGLGCLKIRLEF